MWEAVWLYVFCATSDFYSFFDYQRFLHAAGFVQAVGISKQLIKSVKTRTAGKEECHEPEYHLVFA